jgi:hypothetical protein
MAMLNDLASIISNYWTLPLARKHGWKLGPEVAEEVNISLPGKDGLFNYSSSYAIMQRQDGTHLSPAERPSLAWIFPERRYETIR